jgi:hypothetical protein
MRNLSAQFYFFVISLFHLSVRGILTKTIWFSFLFCFMKEFLWDHLAFLPILMAFTNKVIWIWSSLSFLFVKFFISEC